MPKFCIGADGTCETVASEGDRCKEHKVTIVATLVAGAIGTESYGMDEKGQAFLLDVSGGTQGQAIAEPHAAKVRQAIASGEAMALIYYMWPTKDGKAWIVATRVEGNLETAFRTVKAAKLPKPIPIEGVPSGWAGVWDPSKK
jgi:hypothetical protein